MYVTEPGGDLNLFSAFSATGVVSLSTSGSILNANSSNLVNIRANGILLNSGNSIGTTTDPLAIELTGGSGVAQASSDINLDEVSGGLIVSNVLSRGGYVSLNAPAGSILEASDEPAGTPAVTGSNISLSANATLGAIGIYSEPA